MSRVGPRPTAAHLSGLSTPTIDALRRCRQKLAAMEWPAAARSDVAALELGLTTMEGHLAAVTSASASADRIQTMFTKDVASVNEALRAASLDLA